jgi:endonuclease-8
MPEGDTIFRAAQTLHRALAGRTITGFSSVFPQLNRLDEDAPLTGRKLERVEARGKHLLMHFSDGLILRTHMRMSGSWHLYRPGEAWQRPRDQLRISIETAEFHALAFQVHEAEWLSTASLARSRVTRLGPDVLAADFDPEHAAQRVRATGSRPLCDVLLDQNVLAGIGNVYKSELLFLSRVHPLCPAETLDAASARKLTQLAARLMNSNVGTTSEAGIVTYRGLRRTTGRGDPGERLWVYGRAGKPCRVCAAAIAAERWGQHARRCYFCPNCQRLHGAGQVALPRDTR